TASTMPTIRPASNTSRKTMMSVASMDASVSLFDDQRATRLLVEVIVEFVASRLQRPHVDDAFALCGDHLLHPQRGALEFQGPGIEVPDMDDDGLVHGCVHH